MTDIFLEITRTLIVAVILVLLFCSGRDKDIRQQQGWFYIVAGFGLIFLATVIDITDNFPSLNKYIIIGDTRYQAFIEKVFGYLGGFLLVTVGFWKWLPVVRKLKATERSLQEVNESLDSKVKERTAQLEAEIHERKQAEKEKRILEADLRHAQKMEAIGTMAGGIAHNFNNILTPVMGYAEMIKDEVPKKSASYENIGQVIASTNRAKELVQQIMIFSRHQDSQKETLQLDCLLQEALKPIKDSLPKDITIDEDISSDLYEINVDPWQFKKVVRNLCNNALDAMGHAKGILGIRLESVDLNHEDVQGKFDIELNNLVKLTISDTGRGISKDLQERIFDPFFTTKKVGEGEGIGLSVVQGIVKKSDGMIKVESKPGKGSKFHVFLPVTEAL